MKSKSMIKMVTFLVIFLVICATILGESYTPPGPNCYKNLPKYCFDEVREVICAGPNALIRYNRLSKYLFKVKYINVRL